MKKCSFLVLLLAISALVTILESGCKKDETLVVGQSYQGGVIGYILKAGDPGYDSDVQHGLIAASGDQSSGVQWYNGSNTVTGATATGIGAGDDNTVTIVASQGAGNYAAKVCSDLVLNGYDDWFLPSIDELHILYLNRESIGGFKSDYYWSSTEEDAANAWYQAFVDGTMDATTKFQAGMVRAVRAF